MTFSPLPSLPELYTSMPSALLVEHMKAIAAELAGRGVRLPAKTMPLLDVIEERVDEHLWRTDPAALDQRVASLQAEIDARVA